jgi:hypothetical protein
MLKLALIAQGAKSCKTAWKNVQGIGENSVENCPP